jgi:general secretion pathway protein I
VSRALGRPGRRGFTLLEVMIAVVILAVGLASLFTSEAGAIRIAQRARTTTVASLLARCKMAEVEELVAKQGWPGELIEGRDECCEEGEKDGYSCVWKVERIKLPDVEEDKEEDDDDDAKKGDDKAKPTGMIDSLAQLSKQEPGDRLSGITDMLSGGRGSKDEKIASAGSGDDGKKTKEEREQESMLDPMASMVMNLAFPIMKPVIQEGVRRASVSVNWKEGEKEQTFEVVQFLVSEAQIIVEEQDEDNPNAQTGATGTTGTSTTSTTTTTTTATPITAPGTSSKSK